MNLAAVLFLVVLSYNPDTRLLVSFNALVTVQRVSAIDGEVTYFVYCRIKTYMYLEKNQSAQLVPNAQPSEQAKQCNQPPSGNKSVFFSNK